MYFSMFDKQFFSDYKFIIGCDEVGRGPIAGPVVACATRLPANKQLFSYLAGLGVTDSKKLTEVKRKKILAELEIELAGLKPKKIFNTKDFSFVLWEQSPAQIDRINILNASLFCMREAATLLFVENSKILIDGNRPFKDCSFPVETVVKGDSKSLAIAIASIIAKVFRDEKMKKLDGLYPGYGLASHAGYPTKSHREAVERLGVTPIHRKTFKGVKEFVEGGSRI